MTEDLKGCPFCNSKPIIVDLAKMHHYIRCDAEECRTFGPDRETEEEAITAWNTRHD